MRRLILIAVILLLMPGIPPQGVCWSDLAAWQHIAYGQVAPPAPGFVESAAETERLYRRIQTDNREARATAILAWLKSAQGLVARIPFGRADQEPYRSWLGANVDLAVYSEPHGEWRIRTDLIWRMHGEIAGTPTAEAIGWLAVVNGLPGECEGVIYCYMHTANAVEAEYLRRHPTGAHAREALQRVMELLRISIESVSQAGPSRSFNPQQDCADLRSALDPLRAAVLRTGLPERQAALDAIAALARRCPEQGRARARNFPNEFGTLDR